MLGTPTIKLTVADLKAGFHDRGATCMDYEGNDMSDAVEVGGDVVRAKPGTYHILYVTPTNILHRQYADCANTFSSCHSQFPVFLSLGATLNFFLSVLPAISAEMWMARQQYRFNGQLLWKHLPTPPLLRKTDIASL